MANISNSRLITFFLQDLDGGGAERAIVRLAGEIAKEGYAVELVVGDAASDYCTEVSPGVSVINFRTRSLPIVFCRLLAYLKTQKPIVAMSALDLANIMLIISTKVAGYKGKVVISQRAVIDASLRDVGVTRKIAMKFLQHFCFPQADAVISNSHAAAGELQTRLRVAPSKVFTIPNAIDILKINELADEPLAKDIAAKIQKPFILSIGSLTKRKDLPTLLKAFAVVQRTRDVDLVVLGKGPEKQRIEDLSCDLGVSRRVHMIGFDLNPYKWLKAAAVFVSSSKEEGFPNVIAEALALGNRIVATDCPGDTGELLGGGKWGRLVPVCNAERMAEAILAALDEETEIDVRTRAEDFSPSKITSAYLDVLLHVSK